MTLVLTAALLVLASPPPSAGPAGQPAAVAHPALEDAQLDAQIAQAHKLPFPSRIDALSKLFLGVPYGEFPLGDGSGVEPGPRWNTSAVDCQTYVETVLALANAHNLREARSVLDDIRYTGEPSFSNRNHFTEAQWLPANYKKGYLTDETKAIDGRAPAETLVLRKSDWSKVPALQRLSSANIPDGKYTVRYLPLDQVLAHKSSIGAGSVVMVVRENDPARVVRISHMGFVVDGPKGLTVRHASTGSEHMVIDEPLDDFVQRQTTYKKWKVAGLALAMPVDASQRVASVVKQ
jgi:N-acetylmuramoyl-L-alanine amidase-like protein